MARLAKVSEIPSGAIMRRDQGDHAPKIVVPNVLAEREWRQIRRKGQGRRQALPEVAMYVEYDMTTGAVTGLYMYGRDVAQWSFEGCTRTDITTTTVQGRGGVELHRYDPPAGGLQMEKTVDGGDQWLLLEPGPQHLRNGRVDRGVG